MAVYNKCPFCKSCMKQILFDDGLYFFCDFCLRSYKKGSDGSFIDVSDKKVNESTYSDEIAKIFGIFKRVDYGNSKKTGG